MGQALTGPIAWPRRAHGPRPTSFIISFFFFLVGNHWARIQGRVTTIGQVVERPLNFKPLQIWNCGLSAELVKLLLSVISAKSGSVR